MFLLDTNVVSELRKTRRGRSTAEFQRWAENARPSGLFVSVITLFELELGILMMARRDAAQGDILREWYQRAVLTAFAGRVLTFDERCASRCAGLHCPDPRPERDAMIAATALAHGYTIVTRNIADFQPMGVPLLNPWG